MTTFKLADFDSAGYDDANNFSFDPNPNIVQPQIMTTKKIIDVPYRSVLPVIDFGTGQAIQLFLQGEFYDTSGGDDRFTKAQKLTGKLLESGLKKFYITNRTWTFVFGGLFRPSHLNTQKSTFSYQASLFMPMPFWWTDTDGSGSSRTYISPTLSNGVATDLNSSTSGATGAFTNNGYAPSIVFHIAVENVSGTITKVEIGDKEKDGTSVDGDNIIVWEGTGTDSIGSGETLHLYLLYPITHSIKKWYYFKGTDDDVASGNITSFTGVDGVRIKSNTTNQTFSAKLTGGTGKITFYFYDSNWVR